MHKELIIKRLEEEDDSFSEISDDFLSAYFCLSSTFKNGNTVFVCGNGGSASDAEHLVAELIKSYLKDRPIEESLAKKLEGLFGYEGERMAKDLQGGLPAISLTGPSSIITAISNDINYNLVFSQQLIALGRPGDSLIIFSTSGHSENVIKCAKLATAMNIKTIAFTGSNHGFLDEFCDIVIKVHSTKTPKIQETHKVLCHLLCEFIESELFKIEESKKTGIIM